MSNFIKPAIAVIDSGIGGTIVVNKLLKKYRSGNYIYFADNLFMPYGNKSKQDIKNRVDKIIQFLNSKCNISKILIACNTASTCVDVANYNNVMVLQFNNKETYITTELTKKNLINKNVIAVKNLAKNIEKYIYDELKLSNCIKLIVKRLKLDKLSTFVLGCTHFELAENVFKKYCSNSIIKCNSETIINEVKIDKIDEINVKIITSKKDEKYENLIKNLIFKGIN